MNDEQPVTALSTEEERIDRAGREVIRLAGSGPGGMLDRHFRMTVPADPDRDSDLLLFDGLTAGRNALDREREAVADLRASLAAKEAALLDIQEQLARTQSWMRGANVVIDKWPPLASGPGYSVKDHTDLTVEERWQGVAFSIYTDLVRTSEIARAELIEGDTDARER